MTEEQLREEAGRPAGGSHRNTGVCYGSLNKVVVKGMRSEKGSGSRSTLNMQVVKILL